MPSAAASVISLPCAICPRYNRAVVGKKAEENRGLLHLNYPIENGIVTDWDNMVKVWGHIYEKGALSDTTAIPSEEHPVIRAVSCVKSCIGAQNKQIKLRITSSFLRIIGPSYRSSAESQEKSRESCRSFFRDLQCTCHVHLSPGTHLWCN